MDSKTYSSQSKTSNVPLLGHKYLFKHKFKGTFKGLVTLTHKNSREINVTNIGDPIKRPEYDTIERGQSVLINTGLLNDFNLIR